MKKCHKCQEEKELNQFYKNKAQKDGYCGYCKVCHRQHVKQSDMKHREKRLKSKRKYTKEHKTEKEAYDIIYRANNKAKIAKYKKDWGQKYKNEIWFKLSRNLRRRVHHALKDNYKSAHTMELIGCTIEEFKLHIESQFEPGMSWDNYGIDGWHIDHIKECHRFDLSDPEQQKECFHYTNQRPLWAHDNLTRPKT